MPQPADVEKFIATKFPQLKADRPLMSQFSSIEFVELIDALESEYGVRFSPLDLDAAHFQNASTVTALISSLSPKSRA